MSLFSSSTSMDMQTSTVGCNIAHGADVSPRTSVSLQSSHVRTPAPAKTQVKPHAKLRVAILGSSGSIGTQTLDVCRRHADKIDVVALSVHSSTDKLVAQAQEFKPRYAVVSNKTHAHDAILQQLPSTTTLTCGARALEELVYADDIDCVVCAVVGFAGVRVGYAALKAGKKLAYANKESLVVAGDLLMPLVTPYNLVPVDSEHSAIFQCLVGEGLSPIQKIWLTCSGGPFFGLTKNQLKAVTPQQALAHPTWRMGAKITIDSATLMNKGLEILEAARLFEVPIDEIEVLVHRQSTIHSMVEFVDGSLKAQLGASDMRIAIQYALSYPKRWDTPTQPRLDWHTIAPLSFDSADEDAFGCLRLARQAGRTGKTMPCAMNAANEVANAAFRRGDCSFLDIEATVAHVMEHHTPLSVESIEMLEDVDAACRVQAREFLGIVSHADAQC